MSSAVDKLSAPRSRDAAASRRALLAAASELFHERGYEAATLREIGERARVDPALVARYFGGKEGLYLAALADDSWAHETPVDPHAFVAQLLRHWDQRGHSPVSRALGAPEVSDDVRDQVQAIVKRCLIDEFAFEGRDAALRAEIVLALVLGISLTRSNGTLPQLARASRDQLMAALDPVVDALA